MGVADQCAGTGGTRCDRRESVGRGASSHRDGGMDRDVDKPGEQGWVWDEVVNKLTPYGAKTGRIFLENRIEVFLTFQETAKTPC